MDTYDMGFRDYSPQLNRFLTRDNYNGALADLKLDTDPWTSNRYAFGGGNPITNVEMDGHFFNVSGIVTAVVSAVTKLAVKEGKGEGGPGSGANSDDGFTGSSLGYYQAEWCADIGLRCVKGVLIQMQAIEKSNELADKYNWSVGRRNAFRHSYWIGLMTLNGFTYDEAIALGEAHEKDTDEKDEMLGTPDSNADLHNNATGARLGVDTRPWYVGALGGGATAGQAKELEDRLFVMVGGEARGNGEGAIVCTGDGWLEIVEP